MVITFLDINASYSHSSLALPMLETACKEIKAEWHVVRGTINEPPGDLALDAKRSNPDIILATLYLFTHEAVMKIIRRAHGLCPDTIIILGGPEFLGDNEAFLRINPMVSAVVCGEGELPLKHFLEQYDVPSKWSNVPGLCFIDADGSYHSNSATPAPWPPPTLPHESVFYDWGKAFIQVESSRGCSQRCGFCTSANTGGPNWLPIDSLRSWLLAARHRGITDIRMLDRTFNASPKEATERLELFISEFSDMHFHLEVHPAFLPESLRNIFSAAPDGMFHLEVGIQSIAEQAGSYSGRAGNREQVLEGLSFLCSCKTIQVHADLISGLPGVSYPDLLEDIQALMRLRPDEIQLEVLKVLPGTEFERRKDELGLCYAPDPPYEVLETSEMSAEALKESALLSRLIDRFYNAPMLQPVFQEAFFHNKHVLTELLDAVREDLQHPVSLRKRALSLCSYLDSSNSPSKWTLAYEWLMKGFSPSQCPVPVNRWTDAVPDRLETVFSLCETINWHAPIWCLETPDGRYFFVLDKAVSQSQPAWVFRDLDFEGSFNH